MVAWHSRGGGGDAASRRTPPTALRSLFHLVTIGVIYFESFMPRPCVAGHTLPSHWLLSLFYRGTLHSSSKLDKETCGARITRHTRMITQNTKRFDIHACTAVHLLL